MSRAWLGGTRQSLRSVVRTYPAPSRFLRGDFLAFPSEVGKCRRLATDWVTLCDCCREAAPNRGACRPTAAYLCILSNARGPLVPHDRRAAPAAFDKVQVDFFMTPAATVIMTGASVALCRRRLWPAAREERHAAPHVSRLAATARTGRTGAPNDAPRPPCRRCCDRERQSHAACRDRSRPPH